MPRIPGQIDEAKTRAILEAATAIFSERGLSAPMEAVARQARVSKQTLYNRYRGKGELIRDLIAQRAELVVAPLRRPPGAGGPEETLATFARTLLTILASKSPTLMRAVIQSAGEMPDLAQAVFEAGPMRSRRELAAYLLEETRAGRLTVEDPMEAAEFFAGMVIGQRQLRALLGLGQAITPADIDRVSKEAAARFVRAYAPVDRP